MGFEVNRILLPKIKEPIGLVLDSNLNVAVALVPVLQGNRLIGISIVGLEDEKVIENIHLFELVLCIDEHFFLIIPEDNNVVLNLDDLIT